MRREETQKMTAEIQTTVFTRPTNLMILHVTADSEINHPFQFFRVENDKNKASIFFKSSSRYDVDVRENDHTAAGGILPQTRDSRFPSTPHFLQGMGEESRL